jgi:hypothetical protein
MGVNFDAIPAELRERPQWVVWALEEQDGRQTKAPRRVADPRLRASSTDPATWGDLASAYRVLLAADVKLAGLGYVLAPDDPYVGFDLDLCVDERGQVHPKAQAIIDRLGSYAELSPSGAGVRVLVRAEKRTARTGTKRVPWSGHVALNGRTAEFAAYAEGRFLTLTGQVLAQRSIESRQAELDIVLAELLPEPSPNGTAPIPALPLSDQELLEVAFQARNGAEVRRLWEGGEPRGERSEGDLALANHLAFYFPDRDRLADVLQRSGRERFQIRRHAERDAAKALEGRSDFYSPREPRVDRVDLVQQHVDGGDDRTAGPVAKALEPARVDLVELIRNGIPERQYLPGARFLIAGKRYLFPAPAGDGKSLAGLVIAVDVVEAGGTVVIFDVENGSDEYSRRLADVLEARDDAEGTLARACSERLHYYAYPVLRMDWQPEEWAAAIAGANLVIFDSSRLVLSSAGLAEDKSDDYAIFANALLIPLSRAGVTTVVLDNTGHEDQDRARGSKAKDDLNEVRYVVKVGKPFDRERRGHVRLVRGRTRFAELPGELHVPLGGGTYGPVVEAEPSSESTGFRPTVLMERASRQIEEQPGLSKNAIEVAVGGKAEYLRLALELLVNEGYVRVAREGQAVRHYSVRHFRQEGEAE